ncbi:heavy metal translocating P-type ATPase metal-binding domain-containing protein [Azospirillum sp. SYSU D00513]|uniref:heavy metal translocating P-type ATPase n=1 Tax=Azospirillum sp. SYSU D00513 TaxID=2812561 RepID=UPI001A97B9F6|nr:heavy metal translocating P-type ATPase metal-binding domain-containing protein [Azospirillum sp. SYSU D00513]
MSALLLHDAEAAPATCKHCGQPVAAGGDAFCCAGCSGAYALIHELGLDSYYARRDADAGPVTSEAALALDLTDQVETGEDGVHCLRLRVDGLTCGACVWLIEAALARRPGVVEGRVNLTSRRLTLRWRGPAEAAGALAGVVQRLGYRLAQMDATGDKDPARAAEKELLLCMAVAGFAAMNIMLLSVSVWSGHAQGMGWATRDFMHWLSALIALPTVAYCGRPFFRSARAALRAGGTNMDVPISLGVTLASGISLWETVNSGPHAYFDGAVMLLFFLLIGRYLDSRARGRARSAAEHLLALGRAPVTVLGEDGVAHVVAPASVKPGATVLVAAGERVGIDGTVTNGASDLDASVVTGETRPQPVAPGAAVFAGMVNLTSPLRIAVTASGQGTLLAEMVRLMEASEQGRARFVALADRVARRYTPVVHTLALGTFLAWVFGAGLAWQPALLIAVAVLIITCPCALALAVPAVQVVASGRLMQGGVLLKSATALERLAAVDTVVFDKTGTLTLGRPELIPDARRSAEDLAFAATLARNSRHPLSRALDRAAGPGMPAAGVRELPGRGLELDTAEGTVRLGSRSFCGVVDADTGGDSTALELWLSRPGRAPVRFAFADAARRDAAETVAGLAARGCRVELLSGDRAEVVEDLARRLGIAVWRAGVDPAGKCARLAELRAEGRRVLMVGDGLNDAPALSAADVSASPATATDIAQTSADAVFQGDRLAPVLELIDTARGAGRLVRQNLLFSLLYNLCAVPLAMLGHVTPLLAAVAMSSSSLVVMANALRLSRGRP